jgi:HD-like signal output (HDOD) protein
MCSKSVQGCQQTSPTTHQITHSTDFKTIVTNNLTNTEPQVSTAIVPTDPLFLIALVAIATLLLLFIILRRQKAKVKQYGGHAAKTSHHKQKDNKATSGAGQAPADSQDIEFQDDATDSVWKQVYQLGFEGTAPEDDDAPLSSLDQQRIAEIHNACLGLAQGRTNLPRQPLILPQLMRAIRHGDGGAAELVKIILGDPGLTSSVLSLSNSPYYRLNLTPITNVESALVILGVDGLKVLITSAIMQPAFRCLSDRYKHYSNVVWDLALASAQAAQTYSLSTRGQTPATSSTIKKGVQTKPDNSDHSAYLMGLLSYLSEITLFQLTLDIYAKHQDSAPQPKIFPLVFKQSRNTLLRQLVKQWALGDTIAADMEDFYRQTPLNQCNDLTRAVYFGRLMAALSLLNSHRLISSQSLNHLLRDKGLSENALNLKTRRAARP